MSVLISGRMTARAIALTILLGSAACGGLGDPSEVLDASGAFSLVTVVPLEVKADGAATAMITIVLRDQNGLRLLIGGDAVELSVDIGILSPVTDLNTGAYMATIRSATTGIATLVAAVNGSRITTEIPTVRFVP